MSKRITILIRAGAVFSWKVHHHIKYLRNFKSFPITLKNEKV